MNKFHVSKIFHYVVLISIAIFYTLCFYPGYMSFDSATQYSQVLSGDWTTISPLIMVFIWTFTDKMILGPGGLFLFYQIIFWLGVFLFTINLKTNYWIKSIAMITIALWPFNLMILPHLWKDVGLISFMGLSIGLIQLYLNLNKVSALYVAIISLILASLFRFESIFYIIILIIYTCKLILLHHQFKRLNFKIFIFSFVIFIFSISMSPALVKFSQSKKVTLWPTVAIWDLASISIKTKTLLLPNYTVGQGMTIDDLSQAFYPWSNIPLMSKTKAGINVGVLTPFTNQQYKNLFKYWITTIVNHPKEYLQHRLEVTSDLMRFNESENKPIDLFFSRKMHKYDKQFEINQSSINKKITQWIKSNKDNIVFKGWFYFIIELTLIIYIFFKAKIKDHEFAFFLNLSGMASVFILFFISPSAEQRYLIWLINSTLFAAILSIQNKIYKKETAL